MINIQSFAKAKDSNKTSSSTSGFSKNVTASLDTHTLWGQPFNGTQDVSGNLENVGSITASGNIQTEGDIKIRQLDKENQTYNNFTISVKDKAATFSDKDKYVFDGSVESNGDLNVTGTSTMNDVTVNGDAAFNKNIEVKGQSNLNEVISNNITNSDTIKTKNLEVTGSAHFFELIIDKVKAAGGAVLFTPANGFKVDIVESITNGYKLYWQADDGSGNQADNMWKVNDQALCMSFNQAKEGTSHNVSNKYYWSLVTAVSDTPVNIEEKKYHYIVISTVTKDGTVNPEIGDTIAMLGYRGTDDKKRQSAIYISAYSSLDKGLSAPLLAQYQGINDFNLESHRKSYFDAVGAKFVGNFEVSNGQTIEDYINNKIDGAESGAPYIGANGNWFIWDSDTKAYKDSGIRAEGKDGTSGTNGDNGKDAEFYKLQPVKELAIVDKNGTLGISLMYNIRHIKGADEFAVSASTSDYYVRFKPNTSSSYTNLSVNTTTPIYTNTSYQTNYHKQSTKIEYLTIQLVSSGGLVKDTKVIPVQFAASATLEITDSIKTTVQNNTTSINDLAGKVQTNTNNISTVTQKANSIESTVSSHTTNISNLTGKVESNTKNISSITQKANSIESTVSNITGTLDKTSEPRRNLISGSYLRRVTKKYGGAPLTTNIVKGKKYTFSFNGYCTQELLNKGWWLEGFVYRRGWKFSRSTAIKSISPTTTSLTFTAEYSGEILIDFYPYKNDMQPEMSTTNTDFIVVNWCQLEEGEVVTPWTLAEGESEVKENLISDDLESLIEPTGGNANKFAELISKGCVLDDGTIYDCVHSKYTATTDYYDSLKVMGFLSTKFGETYTLSFYAKGSGQITSYLYPDAVYGWINSDGSLTLAQNGNDAAGDGASNIQLTDKWTLYVITWTTKATAQRNLIISRLLPNTDCYIAAPKLEIGGQATRYDKTKSLIRQTANSILLQVNEVSLKIDNKKIVLDGDTEVNGSLTLDSTDQGFLLKGESGAMTEISPKSIGNYSSFQSTSSSTIRTSRTVTAVGMERDIGIADYTPVDFTWTVTQSLGKIPKGTYLQFTKYVATITKQNSLDKVGFPSAAFEIYENGTLKKSFGRFNNSTLNVIGNYTVSADVEVSIKGTFSFVSSLQEFQTDSYAINKDDFIKPIQVPVLDLTVSWNNILPTNAYMLIGYDGLAVNFGNNKTAYISAEGAIFNYGDYQLKIDSNGISKLNRRNVYVMKGTGSSSQPITYTVTDPIDTVLCLATYSKVIFPKDPYEGQELKIFDKCNMCYISTNNKYLVFCNESGTGKIQSNLELTGTLPWVFTYMNGKWYQEYTG